MLDAGLVRQPRQLHRFLDGGRRRLFDMDVLAGRDRLAHARRPIAGCGAIHEDLVRPGQRLSQVCGPAQAAVRCRQRRQPPGIAPHEQQVGHQSVAIAQLQPALRGDRQEIRHVLRRAHAPGGAVDDDADATVAHCCLTLSAMLCGKRLRPIDNISMGCALDSPLASLTSLAVWKVHLLVATGSSAHARTNRGNET